jgi:rhodanese-related sulfurtransferase
MKKTLSTVFAVSFFVLAAVGLISCATEKASYVDLPPAEAQALIEKTPDIIIIDVSPAYAEGHLPQAVNYYIGDGSLDKAIPTLDKDKTYLVYCHVESASIQGAQKLVDAGFKNVYRLKGEYDAWVDAGYPIEK